MASGDKSVNILDEEDEKLRTHLERYSSTETLFACWLEDNTKDCSVENDSISDRNHDLDQLLQNSEPSASPKQCTNPFLSPALFNNETSDAQSFLEDVLNAGQDLLNDHPCTNPFLENYLEPDDVNQYSPSLIRDEDSASKTTTPRSIINESTTNSCSDPFKKESKFEDFLNDTTFNDENECEILNYFDRRNWKVGEFFPLRVSNIYHPNRFWIVVRYRELEIFMEYICSFYSKNKNNLKVEQVSQNLYCVVGLNNMFYRAIVISFIPNDPHRVKVFLFDYGTILLVLRDQVYYLQENLYKVPQFAVRASLSYICPKNHQTWTSEVVKIFDEFVSNKVLIGQIINIDHDMKCLEMNIGEFPTDGFAVTYINELFIQDGHAKYIFDKREPDPPEYKSKVKHLYLFPTFDLIERGKVASSVYHYEALKNTVAFDVLYSQYCTL